MDSHEKLKAEAKRARIQLADTLATLDERRKHAVEVAKQTSTIVGYMLAFVATASLGLAVRGLLSPRRRREGLAPRPTQRRRSLLRRTLVSVVLAVLDAGVRKVVREVGVVAPPRA